MLALAKEWKDLEAFDFVGAGQDYATAWFGHAKVYEAMGKYAMCVNTEEWLHLNFFMRRFDQIGTVVVCASDSPAPQPCTGNAAPCGGGYKAAHAADNGSR